ncbi:MAG: peptidylprolyl isomerase [Deltaproteobacteria bacterium]|nr:peptidylprolyl isomerase [Deltaproteobacteria bacterium]
MIRGTRILVASLLAVAPAVPAAAQGKPAKNPVAVIETNLGTIEIELWPDKAPKTVENFVTLAKKGFYDGTRFHRLVPGFVIQGGDPLSRDPANRSRWGTGGPGYKFADEPVKADYERGCVAMANSGPDTNGSQFFICVRELKGRLPPKYNHFGKVSKGMDVVDRIVALDRDEADRPKTDVIMKKVTVK